MDLIKFKAKLSIEAIHSRGYVEREAEILTQKLGKPERCAV